MLSPISYWIKAEQRQSILQPKQNSFFFFPSVRNWIQTEHGQLVLQLAEVSITLKQQLNTQCQQTVSAAPREACYYFHFEIECKLSTDNQSYSQQIEHRQSVPKQEKSHHWRLKFVINWAQIDSSAVEGDKKLNTLSTGNQYSSPRRSQLFSITNWIQIELTSPLTKPDI